MLQPRRQGTLCLCILRYSLQMNLNEVSHPACTITPGGMGWGCNGRGTGPCGPAVAGDPCFLGPRPVAGAGRQGAGAHPGVACVPGSQRLWEKAQGRGQLGKWGSSWAQRPVGSQNCHLNPLPNYHEDLSTHHRGVVPGLCPQLGAPLGLDLHAADSCSPVTLRSLCLPQPHRVPAFPCLVLPFPLTASKRNSFSFAHLYTHN